MSSRASQMLSSLMTIVTLLWLGSGLIRVSIRTTGPSMSGVQARFPTLTSTRTRLAFLIIGAVSLVQAPPSFVQIGIINRPSAAMSISRSTVMVSTDASSLRDAAASSMSRRNRTPGMSSPRHRDRSPNFAHQPRGLEVGVGVGNVPEHRRIVVIAECEHIELRRAVHRQRIPGHNRKAAEFHGGDRSSVGANDHDRLDRRVSGAFEEHVWTPP